MKPTQSVNLRVVVFTDISREYHGTIPLRCALTNKSFLVPIKNTKASSFPDTLFASLNHCLQLDKEFIFVKSNTTIIAVNRRFKFLKGR